MSVVPFIKPDEMEEHNVGRAKCLACRHEWEAIAPVGTIWLECPACTLERGRFIAQTQRDGLHWACNCGCDLFYINETGTYCPNCGVWQKW